MWEIALMGQDVTQKQVVALLDAGLSRGVIAKVNEGQPDEGWTFTQLGYDISQGQEFQEWLRHQWRDNSQERSCKPIRTSM
jgi:hypothetical protein